ncbi:MAG: hypothetical protein IKW00_02775 [Clostridia bacterium]|nr:hypothetical protein [Clostridia bacterium]
MLRPRTEKLTRFVYLFTLFSFIVPLAFIIYCLCIWNDAVAAATGRVYSDYVLMLLQCLLGIITIHIPMFFSRQFKVELPTPLYLMYICFLYAAIFLGEVRSFYYKIPSWDNILHGFSSMMTGCLGFMLVALLNRSKQSGIHLSPFFVAMFAFCFSLTVGAVWEIYEFLSDAILKTNMQKFITAEGTILIGHEALRDTMHDFMIDALGAFIASAAGFFSLKSGKGWASDLIAKYGRPGIK